MPQDATRREEEMIAYALETEPALLPLLPELLADLEELGSDAGVIVAALRDSKLPAQATVVDLGCGKGANAIAIARELGLQVEGIDLFEPFVLHSRRRAAEAGVGHLCTFRAGNAAVPPSTHAADAVLFAALGDVLGPLDETMGIIRRWVKPGGIVIVSDPYVREGGSKSFDGFESYGSREETLARLTAHGDVVVGEYAASEDSGDGEDEEADRLEQRAHQVARQHPEAAAAVFAFVEKQRAQGTYAEENLVDAVWVVQRR